MGRREQERARAVQAALDGMRAAGLRQMPSRVLIVERLAETDGHMSAAEIHRDRGDPYAQVHLGTIHRGLDALARSGLVHVVDDHGTQRFGLSVPSHLHAICDRCGAMVEVSADGLEPVIARLADRAGFVVHPDGVVLRGRCRRCAKRR